MIPLFEECFEETTYDLDVAQYNFVGMMLTAIAYGIHIILFLACIRHVYKRGAPLLAYVIVVLTLATAEFILQVWWYEVAAIKRPAHHNTNHVRHHPHHVISLARTVVYMLMNWTSEAILLHRFYIIFNVVNINGHVVLFRTITCLVLAALVAIGAMCIPAITGLGFTWLPESCSAPGIIYLTLSVSTQVILTFLIVLRILLLRRNLLRVFGRPHGNTYTSLAAVLIESASLYTVWALISIIFYGVDSPLQFVFLPALGQIQTLCPLLIINWVVNGRALSKDTYSQLYPRTHPRLSLQFSSNIVPSYPESSYFSPTNSTSKMIPSRYEMGSSSYSLAVSEKDVLLVP